MARNLVLEVFTIFWHSFLFSFLGGFACFFVFYLEDLTFSNFGPCSLTRNLNLKISDKLWSSAVFYVLFLQLNVENPVVC